MGYELCPISVRSGRISTFLSAISWDTAAPRRTAVSLKSTQLRTTAPASTTTPGKRMEFSTTPSMLQPSAIREFSQ